MVLNGGNMAIPEAAATLRAYITRPSRQLKENWEVDLAALLQDYFQYLFKELEKSDNVRNAANFAEAALVIQASSEIYCKKVDYLWEYMVKLLHRLQSENESNRNEASRSELTNNELLRRPLFPPSFWIDAFQIIEAGLRKLLHLGPEDPIDHAAVDAECERHKEQREAEAVPDTQCNQENPSDTQHNEEIGKTMVDEDVGYMTGNEDLTSNEAAVPAGTCDEAVTSTTVDADLCVLTSAENISLGSPPPPPPEPPPVPFGQMSTVLGVIPEQDALALTSSPSTLLEKDDMEVCADAAISRRREIIMTVLSSEAENPFERLYKKKILRKRKTTELTADQISLIESLKDRIIIRPRISPEYLRRDTFLAQHGISIETNENPVSTECILSVIYLIDVKHKKRLIHDLEKRIIFQENLEALRKKYSQDLEEDFRGFEDLEPSDGESDGFCGFSSPPPVINSCATVVEEEEEEDFHGFPDENVPETLLNSGDPSPLVVQNEQQKSLEPESSVKPPERREKDDNAPVIETEAAKKWREFIAPKLTRAWERGHFEIHEYESQILEVLPQNCTTRTFAEVVANKPTEDISRYFLATLQLANSCNIEIRKSDPDPMAINCMEISLLPTMRNEAIGEYHTPSKESPGIRNPFTAIRQPFAEEQPHCSWQYEMQEDSEKPSRKRKCNQSKCKDASTSEDDDELTESEEDEWWLEPKKVARKRKLNKR